MAKKRKVYIHTSGDDLDLILAIADSPGELAEMCETTYGSVLSNISHHHKGWERVILEDDDTD